MSKIPSIDVLKEFIKDKEYVSVSMIQRELSIGYITSQKTIQYLIDKKYLEEKETNTLGHKVISKKKINKPTLPKLSEKTVRQAKECYKKYLKMQKRKRGGC